jgi:hypothetical protein
MTQWSTEMFWDREVRSPLAGDDNFDLDSSAMLGRRFSGLMFYPP